MKGHDDVITLLNEILTAELTAINQYFIHARMCENWGYERLWKKVREESIGEMRHADRLIARARDLVSPSEAAASNGFGRKYFEAMQRDAGVVLAHRDMIRTFENL